MTFKIHMGGKKLKFSNFPKKDKEKIINRIKEKLNFKDKKVEGKKKVKKKVEIKKEKKKVEKKVK